ncbi:MAG TPA: kelch repeat-containing protein [Candidatus Kapabacteria bacterium]|nr:kelch repeat-containing protein [Candidatus Kapabacteria bacterium]
MRIGATFFIAACIFCMRYDGFAQWTQVSAYPGSVSDGRASLVINDTAYVGGGASSSFMQFNAANGTWIPKANIAGATKWTAISFALNGKGYVGGGNTTGGGVNANQTAEFYQYDPATNAWTRKADFGGGARDGLLSFAINDTGYVVGGFDGSTIWGDFWKYDASKDQWIKIGNLPMGSDVFASAFVIDNKAYIATGEKSGPYPDIDQPQVWEYDPSTGNWTRKADFPGAGRNAAVGFALNGKGYIVGGEDNFSVNFTDVWSYDPVADKWTKASDAYPDALTGWMTAFVLDSTAYVGSGSGFQGSGIVGNNSFYSYHFSPSGVAEPVQPDIQLQAYPNPVNGVLTVQTGSASVLMRTELFDVLGNKMDCPVTLSGNTATVNTQSLHPGVYFLHAYDSHGSVVKKIDVMEK